VGAGNPKNLYLAIRWKRQAEKSGVGGGGVWLARNQTTMALEGLK